MTDEIENITDQFCLSDDWCRAGWIGTTFQLHPQSKRPPIAGLIFSDWRQGVNLFRSWVDTVGNADENDDIRVAILEGDLPGTTPGYTIRISPSLNEYLEDDDPDRMQVGQVARMHPQFGNAPDMMPRFEEEYAKHGEFMMAPVVQRDDGQFYMNINAGIIKRDLRSTHPWPRL